MSLRYLIETVVFFLIMITFQKEISNFNQDLHLSIEEYQYFKDLQAAIKDRGGRTYYQRR